MTEPQSPHAPHAAPMSRRGFLLVPIALVAARWGDAAAQVAQAARVARLGRSGATGDVRHPDPRPGITGANVLPPERLPDKPRVRRAYQMAREIPEVFDGLYCHCECEQSHGHRSLLSCFESEQVTGCIACREQAELAYKLHKQGKSLDEIRKGVDEWATNGDG
jgi:hypothetical protein